MKVHDNHITFEVSKRTIPANHGVIGIDVELKVFEGHDGDLCEFDAPLDRAEEKELAEYMIALWQKYEETI